MSKRTLEPDVEGFTSALIGSVVGREYSTTDVARDFRHLMMTEPDLGKRVLFMLMTWCGEFEDPPESNEDLQRWAGKREVAARIKAAMYADLSSPVE